MYNIALTIKYGKVNTAV